jgi:hypothetical protein
VVESLPDKLQALSSVPSTTKKKVVVLDLQKVIQSVLFAGIISGGLVSHAHFVRVSTEYTGLTTVFP